MWKAVLVFLALAAAVHAQVCGNDAIEGGEQCDSGDAVSGDGCSSTCQCEPINANITITNWVQRYACQQGDLLTVEFQVYFPSWAYLDDPLDDIWCDAGDAEAPATCTSNGTCTCTVTTSYTDYTDSTSWSSIPGAINFQIDGYVWHAEGCDCGCDEYVELDTYWIAQCGWCTDNANCTGDGGCASFTCNNATGYCELDESAFDVTLSTSCDLEFCVAKQCKDSIRGQEACYTDEDCPGGSCVVATCTGGAGDGQPCYHTDIDRRRATGADFPDGYLYACYAAGGSCVQGSVNSSASEAAYPLCDDSDPCTADLCQSDLPLNQMCSHQPQACSSDSESQTGKYVVLFLFVAIIVVLLGAGIAINVRGGRGSRR